MFHDERNLRETYLKKKARCVFQYREKSLLLLDSAKSHLGNEVEQAFTDVKSSIQIIHGGMTPSFQFLDTDANKPFKDIMNEKWKTGLQMEKLNLRKREIESLYHTNY